MLQLIVPLLQERFNGAMRTPRKEFMRLYRICEVAFTLVFLQFGGMADQAVVFYKCLASFLSEKSKEHYAVLLWAGLDVAWLFLF